MHFPFPNTPAARMRAQTGSDRFGSDSDLDEGNQNVRSTLRSRHREVTRSGPFRAMNRHPGLYSITSSARASKDGGRVRPSAFAVLRLITSSYLVGACTGRSAGFSPLRMRST